MEGWKRLGEMEMKAVFRGRVQHLRDHFFPSGKRRGWERRIERILIVVVSESARE